MYRSWLMTQVFQIKVGRFILILEIAIEVKGKSVNTSSYYDYARYFLPLLFIVTK